MAESKPATILVPVSLDAEAFQDAVADAIDRAARGSRVTPTEHVHPEAVRVDDVLMVPVRVVSVRPPAAGGTQIRPHIHAIPVAGPWAVNRTSGRIWTHGWTIDGGTLERVVRS